MVDLALISVWSLIYLTNLTVGQMYLCRRLAVRSCSADACGGFVHHVLRAAKGFIVGLCHLLLYGTLKVRSFWHCRITLQLKDVTTLKCNGEGVQSETQLLVRTHTSP